MSLKSKILDYLKQEYPRIVHKGEIGRKAVLEWGYENENAGRRCRELENEGVILKVPNEKHEAQYQWIAPIAPKKEEKSYLYKLPLQFKVERVGIGNEPIRK